MGCGFAAVEVVHDFAKSVGCSVDLTAGTVPFGDGDGERQRTECDRAVVELEGDHVSEQVVTGERTVATHSRVNGKPATRVIGAAPASWNLSAAQPRNGKARKRTPRVLAPTRTTTNEPPTNTTAAAATGKTRFG